MKRMETPLGRMLLGIAALAVIAAGVAISGATRSNAVPADEAVVVKSQPVAAQVAVAQPAAPSRAGWKSTKVTSVVRKAKAVTAPVAAVTIVDQPLPQSGLRAFIDPETGVLGAPSTQQLEALEAQAEINESFEGLEKVTQADGSVMVDLQGRFQEFYMVKLDAKGRRTTVCGRDPRALLDPVAPVVAPAEER